MKELWLRGAEGEARPGIISAWTGLGCPPCLWVLETKS